MHYVNVRSTCELLADTMCSTMLRNDYSNDIDAYRTLSKTVLPQGTKKLMRDIVSRTELMRTNDMTAESIDIVAKAMCTVGMACGRFYSACSSVKPKGTMSSMLDSTQEIN